MSSIKIALVTCSKFPQLTRDDSWLIKPLQNESLDPVAVAWDDKRVDWSIFRAIVFRSCWNYHLYYQEFLDWLDELEKLKAKVWNPIDIIRWNSNKKYLKDLESWGVPIVPTVWIERGEKVNLEIIANEKSWSDIVIKPTVGASAYGIYRADKDNFRKVQSQIDKLISKTDVMVQPVMKEVVEVGEYSIIAIGGKYSHAMLKRPKKGEIRTQRDYGATELKTEPDESLLEGALSILKKIDCPLLYARIDGINQNGRFILMELELIEPELFLGYEKESIEAFVRCLKQKIVRKLPTQGRALSTKKK